MFRGRYVTSALAGCLLGAAMSYLPYRADIASLNHSFVPVLKAEVAFKERHTDKKRRVL